MLFESSFSPADSTATPSLEPENPEWVYAYDVAGKLVQLRPADVIFSPVVYGLLIETNRILLNHHPETHLLVPPGGLVTAELTPPQALRQHFHAATGITPEIGPLLLVEEHFWLTENRQGRHSVEMFYLLTRPSSGRSSLVDYDNPSKPEWVILTEISRDKMHLGYEALRSAQVKLGL
jgi:hypothetical protein